MNTARRPRRVFLLAFLALLWLHSSLGAQEQPAAAVGLDLAGAWQSADRSSALLIEGERVITLENGKPVIRGIVERHSDHLVLRRAGVKEIWKLSRRGDLLSIDRGGVSTEYQRTSTVPPELELKPLSLAPANELPPDRVQKIQNDLKERVARDQEVRRDPARRAEMAGVDAGNAAFLRRIGQEFGWIDIPRFGVDASLQAFLLLQHSGDVELKLAALPFIERDFKLSDGAQSYALFYDRLQLELGRKQRYGTQFRPDAEGNPYVLPLEDPERVNEFLKEIGLPPLEKYLADASEAFFGGKPIRFPRGAE